MSRLLITESATSDIDEIWDYIADDSAERADRLMDSIYQEIGRIGSNPGHRRTDLAEGRKFYSGQWKVISFFIAAIQNRPLFSLCFMGTATFLPFCGSGKISTKAPLQSAECLSAFRFTRPEDPPAVPR